MDPTENTVIESLRPTTVPVGLLALGIVDQIADFYIRLQISGGVYCIVPIANISESYTEHLKSFAMRTLLKQAPAKPQSLFKIGQQFVCKILEARAKASGTFNSIDLIATLDPGHIYEDVIPSNLISIPYAPIQCAIRSIEDHGYQVDIGFGSIFGFLSFEDSKNFIEKFNDNRQLAIGQIVRCCIKSTPKEPDAESRIVHLTIKPKDMTKSVFDLEKVTNHVIPARCLLPGSRTFGTVMKVLENGLIINLMNEFGSFAQRYHLKDTWHTPKDDYNIADEIQCTILFYHPITKTFCVTLKDPKDTANDIEELTSYKVGHFFEKARVKYMESNKSVVFKVDKKFKAIARGRDALDESVTKADGDDESLAIESTYVKGSKHKCRIKSINLADLFIRVSLRKEYMECPQVSVDTLVAGVSVKATIKKFTSRGILVKFGLNLSAMLPNEHLTDTVLNCKNSKLYTLGQQIKCRVLKIDSSKQPSKVYLTHKPELLKKNLNIVDSYNCTAGTETHGVIFKIRDDGLIVELFNNVKGHIPLTYLSLSPITSKLTDLFNVGDTISCVVVRSREESRSLQLAAISMSDVEKIKTKAKSSKSTNVARAKLKKLQKIVKVAVNSSKTIPAKQVLKSLETNQKQQEKRLLTVPNSLKRKLDVTALDNAGENSDFSEEEGFIRIAPKVDVDPKKGKTKKAKFLDVGSGINWDANICDQSEVIQEDSESDEDEDDDDEAAKIKKPKSRRQRSEESRLREEKLRQLENELLDVDKPPQSAQDFEKLVFQSPDSSDVWMRYIKFYLHNVETDKARSICRRALKTIKFRLEKEKIKIWLQLIEIEARFGGRDKMKSVIEEALETNDRLKIYQGAVRILISINDFDEADKIYQVMIKNFSKDVNVWCDYLTFVMEHKKDQELARSLIAKAMKKLLKSDQVFLKSKFAQLEFRFGEVERGKTLFENLLSDNPKRVDLWRVYGDMVRKYGIRQDDSIEIRQMNAETIERIQECIQTVSKKGKTNRPL